MLKALVTGNIGRDDPPSPQAMADGFRPQTQNGGNPANSSFACSAVKSLLCSALSRRAFRTVQLLLDKVEKKRTSPKTWYRAVFQAGKCEAVENQKDPGENECNQSLKFFQFLENFSGVYPPGGRVRNREFASGSRHRLNCHGGFDGANYAACPITQALLFSFMRGS
jgi:hypothetical protein